jgi:hypothetical protein
MTINDDIGAKLKVLLRLRRPLPGLSPLFETSSLRCFGTVMTGQLSVSY